MKRLLNVIILRTRVRIFSFFYAWAIVFLICAFIVVPLTLIALATLSMMTSYAFSWIPAIGTGIIADTAVSLAISVYHYESVTKKRVESKQEKSAPAPTQSEPKSGRTATVSEQEAIDIVLALPEVQTEIEKAKALGFLLPGETVPRADSRGRYIVVASGYSSDSDREAYSILVRKVGARDKNDAYYFYDVDTISGAVTKLPSPKEASDRASNR